MSTINHLSKKVVVDGQEKEVLFCNITQKEIFDADLNIFAPTNTNTAQKAICPHCNKEVTVATSKGKIVNFFDRL